MSEGFLSGKGFLSEAAGDPKERRFTVEGMIQNLPAAALSVGINNLGGVLAGIAYTFFDTKKPGWGALGVEFVSIAMKAAFQPTSDLNILLREAAAGMAGTVGKELTDELMLWWQAKDWTPMQAYPMGAKVKYQGGYFVAGTNIGAGSPPGQDGNWQRLRAQGLSATQWPVLAQAFMAQPQMADGVSAAVARAMQNKHGFTDQETAELSRQMTEAMQTFAKVIYESA
jgi:hypothetical protein